MQASDRVLAGRYAAALFQAAASKSEDQKIQIDLGTVREKLLSQEELIRHPRVSIADKKKLIHAALDGKVSATTLRFLELIIEKKRFDLFVMISAVYGRLAADKRGIAKAIVRSAKPLSADAQKTLAARLKKFSGKDVEIEVKEDPELIGGISVKIGDWVLDSSLRGQLRRMRESFQQSYGH
jgi:F-type H+-transporting ATPase subunit delta